MSTNLSEAFAQWDVKLAADVNGVFHIIEMDILKNVILFEVSSI